MLEEAFGKEVVEDGLKETRTVQEVVMMLMVIKMCLREGVLSEI